MVSGSYERYARLALRLAIKHDADKQARRQQVYTKSILGFFSNSVVLPEMKSDETRIHEFRVHTKSKFL